MTGDYIHLQPAAVRQVVDTVAASFSLKYLGETTAPVPARKLEINGIPACHAAAIRSGLLGRDVVESCVLENADASLSIRAAVRGVGLTDFLSSALVLSPAASRCIVVVSPARHVLRLATGSTSTFYWSERSDNPSREAAWTLNEAISEGSVVAIDCFSAVVAAEVLLPENLPASFVRSNAFSHFNLLG